jgi:hypothetical protein
MENKIKKIFLSIIILEMIFSYAPAFAQTNANFNGDYSKAGVSADIEKYLCSPKIGGSSALYQCINQLYKFAIVIAAVVGVFFIVIAGYIYMSSDGSSEAVDKAKDILTSTITAIVILLAGYVLLNALNPDLIQFHNINPPAMQAVSGGSTTGTTGTTGGTTPPSTGVSGSAAQIAASIKTNSNINLASSHSSGISDPNSTAQQNITDTAAGGQAKNSCYTQNGITAPCKSVNLNPTMLQALLNIGSQTSITVNEIAGGVHSSSPTDSHYTGNAFDVTPSSQTLATQGQIYTAISALGGTTIVECDISNQPHIQTTLTSSNASTYSTCLNQSGYHIHGQW